jgi:hypothetical protein
MSVDEEEFLRIEETPEPEISEAQPLSDSPLLPSLRGRGNRRSSPVTVLRRAGGVGGSARDDNPTAVGEGAAAAGGAAAVVPTPAQLYAEKAYEFYVALEKLNPPTALIVMSPVLLAQENLELLLAPHLVKSM